MILAAACTGGVFLHVSAKADSKSDLVTVSAAQQHRDPTLVLTVGKAEVVDLDGPVSDVMVANPTIVDVVALQSNRLYLAGSNIGDTNLIALDAEGNIVKRMNIHVRVDEITLQESIDHLFPDETIRAKTVNDQIILTGNVSTPAASDRIRDLAARFVDDAAQVVNLLEVDGDQQVMLRMKVMEMSRTALRELGTEVNLEDLGDSIGEWNGSIATLAGGGLTQDPLSVGTLLFDGTAFGPLMAVLNALEDEGLVNILAEPNLTAISGEQAGFLAGGEFPVPTGRDSEGNIQIEFRPFGVSLNFRPTVISEERINLQLETEVSSLDRENASPVAGLDVPGLDIRRASTTVELGSGGSIMIAGLLQSQVAKGLTGLPGIKNTPILGELVKSRSFQRQETELVVVVTAYMIRPFSAGNQADIIPGQIPVKKVDMDAEMDMMPAPYQDSIPMDEPAEGREQGIEKRTEVDVESVPPQKFVTPARKVADVVPAAGDKEDSADFVKSLEHAFAGNIRRTYARLSLPEDIWADGDRYGYLLD